jgi:hypothetical protein
VIATLTAHKLLGKTIFSHLAIHYLGIFTLGMFAAAMTYRPTSWPWKNRTATKLMAILLAAIFAGLCCYWGGADTPGVASEMLAGVTLAIWLIVWGGTGGIIESILQMGAALFRWHVQLQPVSPARAGDSTRMAIRDPSTAPERLAWIAYAAGDSDSRLHRRVVDIFPDF